jgi:hypothetical protein
MVIRPFQEELLDAFDSILAFNGIALKLFFKTLQPLEFMDLENAQSEEQVAEETGTELSAQTNPLIDLGEEPQDNWLLIDEKDVDYDTDEEENELLSKEPKQSLLSKVVNLVSTGSAFPNSKSEQDENIDGIKFFTRYKYVGEVTKNRREFCTQMILADKIYRKEDIIRMSSQVVNAGWGAKGADTYSIWLYKGGGNCHHRWNKQVYASFEGTNIDINSPRAKQIAGQKAEKYGYVIKNPKLVQYTPC